MLLAAQASCRPCSAKNLRYQALPCLSFSLVASCLLSYSAAPLPLRLPRLSRCLISFPSVVLVLVLALGLVLLALLCLGCCSCGCVGGVGAWLSFSTSHSSFLCVAHTYANHLGRCCASAMVRSILLAVCAMSTLLLTCPLMYTIAPNSWGKRGFPFLPRLIGTVLGTVPGVVSISGSWFCVCDLCPRT